MPQDSRVEILRYRPGYRTLRRLLGLTVLGLVLALAYWAGEGTGQQERSGDDEKRAALQSHLNEVDGERSDLAQQLVNATADLEIERGASAQVRTELSATQARVQRLAQQIELYRSLLDSSAQQNGLSIHEIAVEPGARAGVFHLRIVLLQRAQRYAELSGKLDISVRGLQSGAARTLSYAELGIPRGVDKLAIRLLYFQVIERELELPPGFQPQEVVVNAEIAGRGRQRVMGRKSWPG